MCGIICWKRRTGIWTRSQQEPALSTRYRCADAYIRAHTYYNIYICIQYVYELINPFIRITHARDITLSGSQTFQTSKITKHIYKHTHTHQTAIVVYIIYVCILYTYIYILYIYIYNIYLHFGVHKANTTKKYTLCAYTHMHAL